MNDIKGVWLSRYEYVQGQNNEIAVSEHRIEFKPVGNGWIGKSISQPDQSEIVVELVQNGTEFSGTWRERTALSGHYQGREFSGVIMLILNDKGTELNGMWLGASSAGQVKAGSWALSKELL